MIDGSSRVLVRSSVDGGRTWTAPLDVADDRGGDCPPSKCPPVSTGGVVYPPGEGNEHDHVALRYLGDGRLLVVWRDRRYTGGSWLDPWDIFARPVRVGPEGALHPDRAVRVTDHSEQTTTSHRGHMPSEYLGVAVMRRGVAVA